MRASGFFCVWFSPCGYLGFALFVWSGARFDLRPCAAFPGCCGFASLLDCWACCVLQGGVSLKCCLQVSPAFADVSLSCLFSLLDVLGAGAPLLVIHVGSVPVLCTFRSPGQGLLGNPKELGVNVAGSLTVVYGALFGSAAMCTLHTSTMKAWRGYF